MLRLKLMEKCVLLPKRILGLALGSERINISWIVQGTCDGRSSSSGGIKREMDQCDTNYQEYSINF